jgi:PAS domain S-box-containing protein
MESTSSQRSIQKRVGLVLAVVGGAVVALNVGRLLEPGLPASIVSADLMNAITVGALAVAALVTAFVDSRLVRAGQAAVFWIGAGMGLLFNDPLNVVGMVFAVLAFSLTSKYGFYEKHRRVKTALSLGAVVVVYVTSAVFGNKAGLFVLLGMLSFLAFVLLLVWVIFEEEIQAYMARTAGLERDISEQGRRYELAARGGHVGVWDWTLAGDAMFLDPILMGMLGYEDGEVEPTLASWRRILHPDDAPTVEARFVDHLEGRSPRFEVEHRMLHRDGSTRWFLTRGTAMRDAAGRAVRMTGTGTDVTDRKQLEMRLVRTERLRALGEMSASVSHNLNNILTSILGPAQLMRERGGMDEETAEHVSMVIRSANRARELINRLSMALRSARPPLQAVALNDVVRETVMASRVRWKDEAAARGAAVDVATSLAETGPIAATETETHEMLMNLIYNAVDAMPQGGTIKIETRRVDAATARLTVTDTGTGMDEATRKRLFEPFFTTKADVGTGLGLSSVYGSVTRWGGSIDVATAPGRGSSFIIDLPLWQNRAAEIRRVEAPHPREQRRARVLVVDDEQAVALFLKQVLAPDHDVTMAPSARVALDLVERGPFEVAILDLGLPDMPGDELARRIKARVPRVIPVMVTGWTLAQDDPRLAPFAFVLAKPFSAPSEVRDAIDRALALHDLAANGSA